MFTFTFIGGSGLFNPFTAQSEEAERLQQTVAPQTIPRKLPAPPKRPLPSPSESDTLHPSKKRGWTPTTSPASAATSQLTLTNGWLDTPSRYLDAASQSHRGNGEAEEAMSAELPPAKRRKTLTDTIISTAFSAALIGTAVGMTAYRMWRDRGKVPSEDHSVIREPPPPYQKEEWVEEAPKSKTPVSRGQRLPRKPRSVTRRTPRRRMAPITTSPSRSQICTPPPSTFEFQSEENRDEDGLEQQIDFMGDKIRRLIEEGQKALGKEVVVMNDDQGNEDGAVDDGMDGWEEEINDVAGPSSLTSTSYRQPRRRVQQELAVTVSPPNRPTLTPYRSPTSPSRQSRSNTNGKHSRGSSASTSPLLNSPSPRRFGGQSFDGREDFKVIYEPPPAFANSVNQNEGFFQDEDSQDLAERMENIRKAYRIR